MVALAQAFGYPENLGHHRGSLSGAKEPFGAAVDSVRNEGVCVAVFACFFGHGVFDRLFGGGLFDHLS